MSTAYPNPEIAARRNLTQRILRHLEKITAEGGEPTVWEAYHLESAILQLEAGSYANGEEAMLRVDRAEAFEPKVWTSPGPPRSLHDLGEALQRAVRAEG